MTKTGISKVMQSPGRCYVQCVYFNCQRTGTLWEGRYRASLLDSEGYLLCCQRSIELNPMRADTVKVLSEYPRSSYCCNALGEPDNLLSAHEISEDVLKRIREATNKVWALGDQRLRDEIQAHVRWRASPKAKGGDRRLKACRRNGFRFQRLSGGLERFACRRHFAACGF